MTGIPASGKTTIGRLVATEFGLTLLDKDEILESLFENLGIGNTDWRRELSRQADKILQEKALETDGAVIISWWRHPLSQTDSGTPITWFSLLQGNIIELYCFCSPLIACQRFMSRQRHRGHLGELKAENELLKELKDHAILGKLGVDQFIEINTERDINPTRIFEEIRTKSCL